MTRALGGLLLLTGGLALGLMPVRELSDRAQALGAWGNALLLLEGELSFSLPNMPALLERLSCKAPAPAGEALRRVLGRMDQLGERTFAELWADVLTAYSGLQGEDLIPLCSVGEAVCRYDREDRDRMLETARGQLALREAQCREELRCKGRAYGTLGLTLGAFLLILLL